MSGGMAAAQAADCPANPNALGTSRVLTIDPRQYPRIGTIQYPETLPLAEKEVVLTFDDGPMPPYTNRILETLAHECVKANYFIIGRMARGYPELLRRIHAEGHVIGTHSENHPLAFDRMPAQSVRNEIDQGIASSTAALGRHGTVAPFFRIPGLLRAESVEAYLRSRSLVTWSADIAADDWKHISASEVVNRTISRLESKGKGIILLHDIQPATALALPNLLRELKRRGYRVVQVAPAGGPQLVAGAQQTRQPMPKPPQRETFVAPRSPDDPPPQPATAPPAVSATASPAFAAAPPPAAAKPEPLAPMTAVSAPERLPASAPAHTPPHGKPAEPSRAAVAPTPLVPEPRAQTPAVAIVPGEPVRPLTPGLKPSHSVSLPIKLSDLPATAKPAASAAAEQPQTETIVPDAAAASPADVPTVAEPGADDAPAQVPKADPWAWRADLVPTRRPMIWPVPSQGLPQRSTQAVTQALPR